MQSLEVFGEDAENNTRDARTHAKWGKMHLLKH
jgi:hypothetical protein